VHAAFGGEGLVLLFYQDLASYPTRVVGGSIEKNRREKRAMRTADTVYSIIRTRGERGLPLERVQHLLYNEELYLRAYAKLYPNKGAMTKGITNETVDAMSRRKIKQLIYELRQKEFRWTPVRRIHIPKYRQS
jgi:hypothetical protein